MRILFLSHYFPPEVNAPATRTYEHCVRWARAGHDVTVVTCVPNCPDGVVYEGYRNRFWPQTENINGVRVVRVWTYLAPNAGTTRRIANYVSFMFSAAIACLWLKHPHVVVATSPQFFCGWAGVIVSWLKWCPFVLEIRDIWPESITAVGAIRNRPLLRLLEWLELVMYRSARHIVTVGRGYRNNILSKVDVRDRITVIYNGVDLKQFQPEEPDQNLLRQWNLQGKFVCSYIGTIGMAHGLEVVLDAAQKLRERGRRDIAFWLVGDGAQRAALQARCESEKLGEYVVFSGRQPKELMPKVLASSDAALVHLRGCELFETVIPSKIFETMALGVPIIMAVRGQAEEIVRQASAGLPMQPDSADSLVEAVTRLANDPELRMKLGQFARDYVAEHFDRDILAARFLNLLTCVVNNLPIAATHESVPEPTDQQPSVSGIPQ